MMNDTSIDVKALLLDLLAYCEANGWAGYDPYDALNSRLFSALPLLDSRIPRLVLTQALKRSPINIRRLLLVGKTQNAKGIALFLSALLRMPDETVPRQNQLIAYLIDRLGAVRSPESS